MADKFSHPQMPPQPNAMVVPQNHPQQMQPPPQRMMAPHLNPVQHQQMPMQPSPNQQLPPSNAPHVQNQPPQVRMPMQNTGHLMPPPIMPPPVQRPPMYSPQQYMSPGPPQSNMMNRNLPPTHQMNQQPPSQIQSPMNNRMAPPQSSIVGNNYPGPVINQAPVQMSGRGPIAPPGSIGQPQQIATGPPNSAQIVNQPNVPIPGQQQSSLKRPAPSQQPPMQSPMTPSNVTPVHQSSQPQSIGAKSNKKKKLADKILPQKVLDLVPESHAYMDLLSFERKLDFTITRKRLDIQESIKRPMKQKRKLRIFISNTFSPGKAVDGLTGLENDTSLNSDLTTVPSWELRVEGRLLDDQNISKPEQSKMKRKFSSFFKSLVIELDKDLYGPDNHLVEWHRTPTTGETDGFQVKRPGAKDVKCSIFLLLDYQPIQHKLDSRLARLLGIHTQTRPMIINALWQYIKTHKLQDAHEREFINCDKYLEQIFGCPRMRFGEIPERLRPFLFPAEPIQINHIITVDPTGEPNNKKTACYDIEVEIDDPLKQQMSNFVLSTTNQQEITTLDSRIHETVDTINELKTNREFLLSFANDPQKFIQKWLISQMHDLKVITDQVGNPEEERKSDFFYQAWTQEAVCRYFYGKVQQKRAELEQALGIRNT